MQIEEVERLLEYGRTVSEIVDELSVQEAYHLFEEGRVDYEADHERETVLLDSFYLEDSPSREELLYESAGGLGKILKPANAVMHRIPYSIGERTADKMQERKI